MLGKALNLSSFLLPKWTSTKAIQLFCTPRKGEIRPKDKKYLDTSEQKGNFQAGLGNIQYYIWNETGTKTILLLHGWESNSARWRFLISVLKKSNYRFVAIDAPAHGASDSKTFDVHQFAQAIDVAVQKFDVNALIGHSAGGLAINWYLGQFEYPKLDNIVLLGAPSGLDKVLNNYYAVLKPSRRAIELLEQNFEKSFEFKIDDMSAFNMVAEVSIPTLIIHDKHDAALDYENAIEFDKHFVNSTLMITEGFGHGLQHRKIFEAITEFLKPNSINQ